MKWQLKSETLALKKLYQLQKIGYFRKRVFKLNLNISGTLAYNFFLILFSGKNSWAGMKSRTQFLRKQSGFYAFLSFSRDIK